jgi:hypothetical protein
MGAVLDALTVSFDDALPSAARCDASFLAFHLASCSSPIRQK